MTPLSWLISGVVMIILEIAAPGFVICFFGFGAILTSLLLWLSGIMGFSFGIGAQAIVFALSSVLLIVLFRKFMKKIFVGDSETSAVNPDNDCVGKVVSVIRAVSSAPGGRVSLYGTDWSAVSTVEIPAGTQVRVVKQDNLTLTVEPMAD